MSEKVLSIYEAIPKVMEEIGVVGKNKRNEQGKFNYRGIDDVMNALNPAMTNNGVFVIPNVIKSEYTTRATNKGGVVNVAILTVEFTFYAKDGSYVTATTVGEAMDSGDKATNKAMAVALKYACFQTFMIPTEEMARADPDGYGLEKEDYSYPVPPEMDMIWCASCGTMIPRAEAKIAYRGNEQAPLCDNCYSIVMAKEAGKK